MQISRAQVEAGTSSHDRKERETGGPIKLDAEAQANIEKHRYAPPFLAKFLVDPRIWLSSLIIFYPHEQPVY